MMNDIETLSETLCDDSQLTIAKEWMEKLQAISGRGDLVENLLVQAQANENNVKPSIFARVERDYQARLAQIQLELKPVAEHVHKELVEIESLESKICGRLELVEDELEEQAFRSKVGEFSKDELNRKVESLAGIKKNLSSQVELVGSTYAGCAEFLGDNWRSRDFEEDSPRSQIKLELETETETKPKTDIAALVWADLGTPVAPQIELDDEAADAEVDSFQESDSPALACESVSKDQIEVRAQLEACLQMLNANGEPELFELGKEGLSIGKSTVNDVVLKKAGVSRRHARVAWRDSGEFTVHDLSGRGIGVNGELIAEAVIRGGDTITVGKVEFELIAGA